MAKNGAGETDMMAQKQAGPTKVPPPTGASRQ